MSDNGAATRFHLAGPEIISETFDDGESIVVNLQNGFYYSLNSVGGLAFELLGSGASVASVEAEVGARFAAEPETIHAAVAEFITGLVEEGLLVAGAPAVSVAAPTAEPPAGNRDPFEAPALTAYTDMQDLLLADPIHDYDDTGWPARVDER